VQPTTTVIIVLKENILACDRKQTTFIELTSCQLYSLRYSGLDWLSENKLAFFLDILTLDDGTNRLSRNAGTKLSLSAA
jgi:hypothetical protein